MLQSCPSQPMPTLAGFATDEIRPDIGVAKPASRPSIEGGTQKFERALTDERIRESRNQLDEIRLPARAGLLEKSAEMRLDRGIRDAQVLRHFRHAADI